jgi:hypothetical protein
MRPENNPNATLKDQSLLTTHETSDNGEVNSGQKISDQEFLRDIISGIVFSLCTIAVIIIIFTVRYLTQK